MTMSVNLNRENSLSATLQDHCLLYLTTHIADLSPEALALLPKHLRLALLKSVATIHLYWLEQTKVAKGIDTEPIWRTFNDVPFHRNTWAVAYPEQSDDHTGRPLRDLYAEYMFSLSQNYANKEYNSKRAKVALFGLFEAHLPAGVYLLLQIHCASLKDSIFQAVIEMSDYYLAETHESWEHGSIIETLLKYNAIPRKLRIPVTSRLALNAEPTNLLLRALSKANVQSISVFNTGTNKQHDKIVTLIVETVIKRENITLENLDVQLANAKALHSVTKYFTAPDGYSSLKEIHFSIVGINSEDKSNVQLLPSMVQHQTSLEHLTLEGDWLYTKEGVNISSDIAPLFDRPHFRRLDLRSDIELPQGTVHLLITSFLHSKSRDTQELHLRGLVIPGGSPLPDDKFHETLKAVWKTRIDYGKSGQQLQHTMEERMRHQVSMYNRSRRCTQDRYSFGENLIRITTMAIQTGQLEKVGMCIESDYYKRALDNRPVKYPKIDGNPFAKLHFDEGQDKQECFMESENITKDHEKGGEGMNIEEVEEVEDSYNSCADEEQDVLTVKTPSCVESMDAMKVDSESEETMKRPQKILVFEKVEFFEPFLQWLCNQSCICLLGLEVEVAAIENQVEPDKIKALNDFFCRSRLMQMERLYCSFNVYEDLILSDQ